MSNNNNNNNNNNDYQCNLCNDTYPQPPHFMAYIRFDRKKLESIKIPQTDEYIQAEQELERIFPKITDLDYKYMANIHKHTDYLLFIILCENCFNEVEDFIDIQYVKHQNR